MLVRVVITDKENGFVKRKIRYTDEPMGTLRVVGDFLPAPEKLVLKQANIRIMVEEPRWGGRGSVEGGLDLSLREGEGFE